MSKPEVGQFYRDAFRSPIHATARPINQTINRTMEQKNKVGPEEWPYLANMVESDSNFPGVIGPGGTTELSFLIFILRLKSKVQ